MASVEDLSNVGRLVYLMFAKGAGDIQELADDLYREGKRTAEETLLQEAHRVGCGVLRVTLSGGELLAWIKDRSEWAARSICDTYNAHLASEIARIIAELPTANRWTVASRLKTWDASRQEWKSAQVAVTETFVIEHEAKMRFNAMNAVKEPQYWFGYSLQCELCQNIAAGNPHTREYAQRVGLPHVGCLDHWHVRGGSYVDCTDLWLGE